MEQAFKETSKPLLSAAQIRGMEEEKSRLERMLDPSAPTHIRSQLQDSQQGFIQLRKIRRQLASDAPNPYEPDVIGRATRRESHLRETMVADGMPTQEEMRKNPPGAVNKHLSWEKRHKSDLLEWKNIKRRLAATGEADADDRDLADFERYRPRGGSSQLSMDNAQIAGKQVFLPPGIPEIRNVMSDEDREAALAERAKLSQMVQELSAKVSELEERSKKRPPGRPRKTEAV